MAKIKKQDALDYHSGGRPGKIEVIPTKPYNTQRDLSLAYSPGVAEPCLEIEKNPEDVYKYTAKGNLVAVISNGTAVLGLGNIGPAASKPVMEGKGLLFKIYADIDVFDIEIDETDIDAFVRTVKAISPTFGGINLEDIKAPECFEIERRLKEELDIPLMHDDQHGTAIITSAALLNALLLSDKKIEEVYIVVNGAGASAISCTKLYLALGAKKENIVMLDSSGVIRKDRENLDATKAIFATSKNINTLEEAMVGADVFLGLSKGNIVSKEMLLTMGAKPIVFALANPDPEISYADAVAARPDAIVATGRSDNPNQVNNVLGFPFIFRGALDVRATKINEEMKLAAVYALAELAKEAVPENVNLAYNSKNITFGKDYIIPKPVDNRLIYKVAPAVAKAAIESGVARYPITDWEAYENELIQRLGLDNKLMKNITIRAKQKPQRVVFAEADHYKILKAAQQVKDEGIAIPILLGDTEKINKLINDNNLDLKDINIIDIRQKNFEEKRNLFGDLFFEKRKRRGFTLFEARKAMLERNYYGAMMVETGEADAMISGLTRKYPDTIRPSLQIIGVQKEIGMVAGMYIMVTKKGPVFFADTTINTNPTAEQLVKIVLLTANAVRLMNIVPRIALLSYSNFGSVDNAETRILREAIAILHRDYPDLIVDGEVQANIALNKDIMEEQFPFSPLKTGNVNTLIFPNLASGNIAYKLMQEMGTAEAIGPVLLGLNKSVHILQLGSSVREIVNMVTLAVADAQVKNNVFWVVKTVSQKYISMLDSIVSKHTAIVKQEAAQLGFDFCGISTADFLAHEAPQLESWLNNNYHGTMAYMANYFDKRLDPRLLVPGAKSVISLMINYFPEKIQVHADAPKISKYAYGADYHEIIKNKLNIFIENLKEKIGEIEGRAFVDSAPVMDKAWAKKSGMGWMGKNTNIIHKNKGSFFIAELITDLVLTPDHAVKDYCGTCTRCIDACPTDALFTPYQLDASKCISYLTIELKEEIPNGFKGQFENWAFGCDICQDVCPWNKFSKLHHHEDLKANDQLLSMSKKEWLEITEDVFQNVFKKSAVKRTKFKGLKRNINFISSS